MNTKAMQRYIDEQTIYDFELKIPSVVALMRENGISKKDVERFYSRPWFAAIAANDLKALNAYIRLGVDLNMRDYEGEHALMFACFSRLYEIIELLVQMGSNIDLKNKSGLNALMRSAIVGDEAIVKMLIENNANVNLQNELGLTALMMAADRGNLEIVKILLDSGADMDILCIDGKTALDYAESAMRTNVADYLLQYETETA